MLLTSFRRFFVTQALFDTMPKRSLISKTKEVELEIEGLKFVRLNPAQTQPKVSSALAGKPFLPGSTGRGFPEVLSPPTETFPHAVKIKDPHLHPFSKLVDGCRRYITDNLYRYGAVLLRNLPLKTTNDFASLCQGLGFQAMRYEAGTVERKRVDDSDTYTATDEPPEVVIDFHNEMAYSPAYAAKVLFFCHQEPGEYCGGETPLVKGADILSHLDPKIVQTFDKKRVCYVRCAPSKETGLYLPWQDTFMTEDPKIVEHFLTKNGFSYKWEASGTLIYWNVLPAFQQHPETGETMWFNQIQGHHASALKDNPRFKDSNLPFDKYPYHTYYGDGSEIEPVVLENIRAVTWSCAVGFRWRTGDVLVVDNLAVQHARMSFTGQRKILAVLSRN